VGPRAGLDRCGKSRPPPVFDPQTVQLVASRYTDHATRPTDFAMEYNKREALNRTVVRVESDFRYFPNTALQINIYNIDALFSNVRI
jgi:hypothetical protein